MAIGTLKKLILLFAGCVVLTAGLGVGGPGSEQSGGDKKPGRRVEEVEDQPLEPFRRDLLALAFETATMIPINPHIKDRSKTQAEVVTACLELEQGCRALGYIEKIDNWMRGAGYGDFALYCVRRGYTEGLQRYLDLAADIAETANQDWRRDHVRVKIAQVYALLGQTEKAAEFEAGVEFSEMGKVAAVKAMQGDEESFDEQVQYLDGLIASKHFDLMRNAQEAYAELYHRHYENGERRAMIEEKLRASWAEMPGKIPITLLAKLAGFALDHGDKSEAVELVNEAKVILEGAHWPDGTEQTVPLTGRLAALRFRAGEEEKSRLEAAAALGVFYLEREKILSIYRARTLRALAEAYQAMGDTAGALAVYRKVVEEGIVNPNSRPRAEDLSATCVSMALHGVEPDANLLARIHTIKNELGHPW